MQLVIGARQETPPAIYNIHLTSHAATDDPGRTMLRTTHVRFGAATDAYYGGTVSHASIVNDKVAGISLRAFLNRPHERAAAQAVLDAINASGLLERDLPKLDWKRPEVGRTRLYFDRRSRFFEFDTANPPAVVQGVLGAIAAYEQAARGTRVAA